MAGTLGQTISAGAAAAEAKPATADDLRGEDGEMEDGAGPPRRTMRSRSHLRAQTTSRANDNCGTGSDPGLGGRATAATGRGRFCRENDP